MSFCLVWFYVLQCLYVKNGFQTSSYLACFWSLLPLGNWIWFSEWKKKLCFNFCPPVVYATALSVSMFVLRCVNLTLRPSHHLNTPPLLCGAEAASCAQSQCRTNALWVLWDVGWTKNEGSPIKSDTVIFCICGHGFHTVGRNDLHLVGHAPWEESDRSHRTTWNTKRRWSLC